MYIYYMPTLFAASLSSAKEAAVPLAKPPSCVLATGSPIVGNAALAAATSLVPG